MSGFRITDWDDAYTNGAHIANGENWPEAWVTPAAEFRAKIQDDMQADIAYGQHDRNRYDLFYPALQPKGLFVFIHGGYWMALDKSYWSHLAQGAIDNGWAVAIPSYVLCPEVTIENITGMISEAIVHAYDTVAAKSPDATPLPIILSGHSAGGHLVASMVCQNSPLADEYKLSVQHVVSLSGVHDLRPLLNTSMNNTLKLDNHSATAQSPALMQPIADCCFTAWVGGSERAEFIRQSELISNMWRGLGAWTQCVVEPNKHHFNVIDNLADKDSPLVRAIFNV